MVYIRQAQNGDGRGIIKCFNEGLRSGTYKYTGSNMYHNRRDIVDIDAMFQKNKKGAFGFVAVDGNKIVGVCIFLAKDSGRTRHRGEVSWGVHPDYFKHKIGTRLLKAVLTEASKRGFVRVEAESAKNNIPSTKLAKKLGFKLEGIKKRGLLIDNGKYVDTLMFCKILT